MIIVVGIPIMLILFSLLGIVGLADILISRILTIIYAIFVVGFVLAGCYLGIKQLIFAIKQKKVIGLVFCVLNLFSGIFFPVYIYSCVTTATGSLEKGMMLSALFNGVLFVIYYFIDSVSEEYPGNLKSNLKLGITMILILAIATIGVGTKTYNMLRRNIWEMADGMDTDNKYVLTKDVFPRFGLELYKYNKKNKEIYSFYYTKQ